MNSITRFLLPVLCGFTLCTAFVKASSGGVYPAPSHITSSLSLLADGDPDPAVPVASTITCSDASTYTFTDVTRAGRDFCSSIPPACVNNVGMNNSLLYTELVATQRINSADPDLDTTKNDPTSTETFSQMKFRAGHIQAPIAIVFGTEERPKAKAQFWLETDKFSLLEVLNSTSVSLIDPASPTVAETVVLRAEFANFTTQTVYRAQVDPDDGRFVVPYWNLIIDLDKGVVSGLSWDNSCGDCEKKRCVAGQQCGVKYSDCLEGVDGLSCDVKFYVAWRGTDAEGSYLTSINNSIRNFRMFSFAFLFDYAARTARAVTDNLPDTFPDLPDWNIF